MRRLRKALSNGKGNSQSLCKPSAPQPLSPLALTEAASRRRLYARYPKVLRELQHLQRGPGLTSDVSNSFVTFSEFVQSTTKADLLRPLSLARPTYTDA